MSLNILSNSRLATTQTPQPGPLQISTTPQPHPVETDVVKFKHSNNIFLLSGNLRGHSGYIVESYPSLYKCLLQYMSIIPIKNWSRRFAMKTKRNPDVKEPQIGDVLSYGLENYEILGFANKLYLLNIKSLNREITFLENNVIKIVGFTDKKDNLIKLLYKQDDNQYKLLNMKYSNNKSYETLLNELSTIIKNNNWNELNMGSNNIDLDESANFILPIYYFIYRENYFVSEVNYNGFYGTLIKTIDDPTGYFIMSHTMVVNLKRKEIQLDEQRNTGRVLSGPHKDRRVQLIEITPISYKIYSERLRATTSKIEVLVDGQKQVRGIFESDIFYKDLVLNNGNYFYVSRLTKSGNYEGRELDTQTTVITPRTVVFQDIANFNTGFKIVRQPGVTLVIRGPEVEQLEQRRGLISPELLEDERAEYDEFEDVQYEEPYEEEGREAKEYAEEELTFETIGEQTPQTEVLSKEAKQLLKKTETEEDELKTTFRDIERVGLERIKLTEQQKVYLSTVKTILRNLNVNETIIDLWKVVLNIETWITSINKQLKDKKIIKDNMSNRDEKFVIANVLYNRINASDWSLSQEFNLTIFKNKLIETGFFSEADIELNTSIFLKQNMPYIMDEDKIEFINTLHEENNMAEIIKIVFDNCREMLISMNPSQFAGPSVIQEVEQFAMRSTRIPVDNILKNYINSILNLHNISKDSSELQSILNAVKENLYKTNLILKNKQIPVISNSDTKYIVAIHLANILNIDEKTYVEKLIQNDFINPSDFRIRSTLFLIDIADELSPSQRQEMEVQLRSLARIPDYKGILMIMYNNAKNLYDKIQMQSFDELQQEFLKPKPITKKRKLETKIVYETQVDTILDTEYIKSRIIPAGITKISWSKLNLRLITNFVSMLEKKRDEEKQKTDIIRQFVVEKAMSVDKELLSDNTIIENLRMLISTAKYLLAEKLTNANMMVTDTYEEEAKPPTVNVRMYKILNRSQINIENLISITEKLLTKINEIISKKSFLNIKKEFDKIIEDKKSQISWIYNYINANFADAPFVIPRIEDDQRELAEEIASETEENKNKLIEIYNNWNIILAHFKYVFNKFLDIVSRGEPESLIEQQRIQELEQQRKIYDIRSKFPKVEAPDMSKTKMKKEPQRIGLTKEAREFEKQITKKTDKMEKLLEKTKTEEEQKQIREDIQELKLLKELVEDESLTPQQKYYFEQLSEELQSKLQSMEYEDVIKELEELGLKK